MQTSHCAGSPDITCLQDKSTRIAPHTVSEKVTSVGHDRRLYAADMAHDVHCE